MYGACGWGSEVRLISFAPRTCWNGGPKSCVKSSPVPGCAWSYIRRWKWNWAKWKWQWAMWRVWETKRNGDNFPYCKLLHVDIHTIFLDNFPSSCCFLGTDVCFLDRIVEYINICRLWHLKGQVRRHLQRKSWNDLSLLVDLFALQSKLAMLRCQHKKFGLSQH